MLHMEWILMTKGTRALRSDGEVTRDRILVAAGELFAVTGFAETTNKAVAARAGVDLASINYHFGSRGGLYQAVLAEAHRHVLDLADLQLLQRSGLSPEDKLRTLLCQLVESLSDMDKGWYLSVLLTEIMNPSSHLQLLMQTEVGPKVVQIKSILGDITGIPPEDPAILRCLMSVAAPVLALLIGRRRFMGPLDSLCKTPDEMLASHLFTFSLAGLRAVASEYHPQPELPLP